MEKKASVIDLEQVLNHKYPTYEVSVTNNEMILYSLGIGFSQDPLNQDHYKFTYEADENFQAFATMASVIAHKNAEMVLSIPGFPSFNPMTLLYGEENMEIFDTITPDTLMRVEERVLDVADKTKMTALTEESLIKNAETGKVLVRILKTLMIRGVGGYGYKGGPGAVKYPDPPARAPDQIAEGISYPNQAILYRLNGDINPLHINPDVAEVGGFQRPIIHGLCTAGITARLVYEKYCNGDPKLLSKYSTRFTSHIFPGETYIVEIWKEGNTLIFQTKTKERGLVALKGFAELREPAKL